MNKLGLITFLSLFLNACSPANYIPDISLPSIPSLKAYKADVQQGSVLSRFTINQLKTGMSKHQVQDIIGQPSIIDPFHNNQWDYVHHTTLGSDEIIRYRLTLIFAGNKLSHINTDGITALAKMTDKEVALEKARLAKEKTGE